MLTEQTLRAMKALADPRRAEIVHRVASCDKESGTVCGDLLEGLGISQSTLSHHITELVECGLLNAQPQGRFVHLTINRDFFELVLKEIRDLAQM